MHELTHDPFYELIRKYDRCIIDYCLIEDEAPYQGYRSHKDVVLFAMGKVIERDSELHMKSELESKQDELDAWDGEPIPWSLDIERARAERIDPNSLLFAPTELRKDACGTPRYDCKVPNPTSGEQIPYWHAFLNPPHRTGYSPEEFHAVNAILFPNGTKPLEVYEWSTDWSSYFDAGHEWWGAACLSVYDMLMNRYVVILASATD